MDKTSWTYSILCCSDPKSYGTFIDGNSEIGAYAGKEQLFDLYKEFDLIESNQKSEFFLRKDLMSILYIQNICNIVLKAIFN